MSRRGLAVGAALAVTTGALLMAPAAGAVTSGDASAKQGANACSWTMETAGVRKVVAFADGTFQMSSFVNKLASPAREYVQGATVSPEFRFSWDAETLTGASGGWSCTSGSAVPATVGGQEAIRIDVALTRSSVRVDQHYVVFPSESVVRQWTAYTNVGTGAHTLATPSFLEQHMLSADVSSGAVDLQYITGAGCCNADAWTLRTTRLSSSYARTFDSYDPFGCVDEPDGTPSTCTPGAFAETSSRYMPWFSLFNTAADDGVIAGFDYLGRWQAPIGASDGAGSLSVSSPNFSASLAAGATETMPQTFVMTYVDDLDDMTNRVLDWQYRYLWDYTREGYFAAVAAPGNWCAGTHWCGGDWDQQGIRQKIYNLSDRERQIGIDTDWRDNGWWDEAGDWNGPDFKLTNDLLAKAGQKAIIYYPAYGADTSSQTYAAHPSWFANASPCGYTDRLGDMSITPFATWMTDLMITNAERWGDHEFRNDACPVTPSDGRTQLHQDQAFRGIIQSFLTARPASAFYAVNSGGNEIGWDMVRMASQQQTYDTPEPKKVATAAMLFPVDKLSGDPNPWSDEGYCSHTTWQNLAFNMSFYSSVDASGFGPGDTVDPTTLECARKLIDAYHYLTAQGVVGRWVRQYHPDDGAPNDWFQRLNRSGSKGIILRLGDDTASSVTVHPKGLNPSTTYDVRYQFTGGSASRTGSDLMTNGITLRRGVDQGEIVYLNLRKHPGAGTDRTAPTAPRNVTATAATNVNYPGVDVRWSAGRDDNWVSYYNVYRDGTLIGKTAKGTYYHDHTPAATPRATYSVRTVDGDGNSSPRTTTTPPPGQAVLTVDDAKMRLDGFLQLCDEAGNFDDTLAGARSPSASASYTFRGSAVTLYAKMGPNEGKAAVTIDGATDTIDLYAPDSLDTIVPIHSKTWASAGRHTITVRPTGTRNAKATDSHVYVDGLQIRRGDPAVTETSDTSAITYTGEWTHSTGVAGASNRDLSASTSTGASAQYRFTSSRVRLIGRYCPTCGMADVYIDGDYDARIDLWGDRGAHVDRTVIYDRSFPTVGKHTIKLVVNGTKNLESTGTSVNLDAVQTDRGAGRHRPHRAGRCRPSMKPVPVRGPYAKAVAADDPVIWYRMDESDDLGRLADASGNGNIGSAQGDPQFGVPGALASRPLNAATAFDGTDDWVNAGNPTALRGSEGSVEAWIKTTATDADYHAVAIKWYAYGLFVKDGELLAFDWGAGAERNTGVNVADGAWHHVVLNYRDGASNGSSIYIDGAPALTTTITAQNQAHNAIVSSGSTDSPTQFFPGTIDEVAYYGAPLSAARIRAHHDAAAPPG